MGCRRRRPGVLLPGDIIQVVHDRDWVSFMYSYVNLIPLPPSKVRHLVEAVEPYDFDRIYSPWLERIVMTDGKARGASLGGPLHLCDPRVRDFHRHLVEVTLSPLELKTISNPSGRVAPPECVPQRPAPPDSHLSA